MKYRGLSLSNIKAWVDSIWLEFMKYKGLRLSNEKNWVYQIYRLKFAKFKGMCF